MWPKLLLVIARQGKSLFSLEGAIFIGDKAN
jgi:hypothetical protein